MKGKTSNKYLAILCAVVVALTSISFPAKAAEIDFNDTKYADWDKVTFSDWNIANNTYEGLPDLTFDINYKVNLENKVLCGTVTFSDGWASLYIGGTNYGELWSRVNLQSGVAGYDADQLVLNVGGTPYPLDPDIAGTTLVGEAFELKLSYETEDHDDDGVAELKLGVWIEDILYNQEYIYAENPELYLYGCMGIHASGGKLTVASWIPKEKVLFNDTEYAAWDKVTFNDWNIADNTYESLADLTFDINYKVNLENKVLCGTVTFSDGWASLYIGGTNYGELWSRVSLQSGVAGYDADQLVLNVGGTSYPLDPDIADTTLVGEAFDLKLSYETEDHDDDGVAELKLGVWIEDTLYNQKYIYAENPELYLYGCMGIHASGGKLTVASWIPKEEVLFYDTEYAAWDTVSFNDWGFEDGTYQRDPETNDIIVRREYTDTLAGKVFSGDVVFHDGEYEDVSAMMYIGGAGTWDGMILASDEANQTLKLTVGGETHTLKADVAGLTSFFDKSFNLKLSYEVVDNALQLGVWFENKLYNSEYIPVTKGNNGEGTYEDYLTGKLAILATGWASLTIASDTPKVLNSNLDQITFSDWGFEDGTYQRDPETNDIIVKREYTDTLAGKVFSGNVIFHDGEYEDVSAMMYIGGAGTWDGMLLASDEANQTLVLTVGGETYTFYSNVARVTSFFDNEFNLKLSYEVIDNALQLGVWFNDKLYDNEYITVTTGDNGEGTYESYLTGKLAIMATGWASLTIDSDQVEVLDPTLEQITFSDWGLEDKTHTPTADMVPYDAYKDSLSGKVFSGYVTFSPDEEDGEAYLLIGKGANVNLWSGLCLRTDGNTGNLILAVGGQTYTIASEDVGDVPLVNNSFNLKLSYQTIDSDEDGTEDALKLGVWVDDTLYKNEYIVITTYDYVNGDSSVTPGRYDDYLMGPLGIHATGTSSLTVRSDKLKALDSSLEQISFSHYGWENGTYTGTSDIIVEREYTESLGNKVISVDVIFTPGQDGNQAYMCIGNGAKNNVWSGLCLQTDGDSGNLLLHVGGQTYTLEPLYAGGVGLVNNKFNLKLSYEVVDTDEDGTEDALQLGVWIDNKLYKNEYIMISNYVYTDSDGDTNGTYEDYLTGGIGIHAPGNASLTINSDIPEVLPKLEHITFNDWGWDNGTYSDTRNDETGESDIIVKRGYEGSYLDKIFCGDVTFSSSDSRIYIGGGEKGIWSSLYLMSGQTDGSLKFGFDGKQYTIQPLTAIGADSLTDKSINLKISYQVEDEQLKLGLWFNNRLYNNEYFYATDYQHYLAGGLGIYAPKGLKETGAVTIASEVTKIEFTEVLNDKLEHITFSDFGWQDGTYSNMTDIMAKYEYLSSFEGKVFCGDVTFSAEDARIHLGGGKGGIWSGLYLMSGQPNGNLLLGFGGEQYTISPKKAGTTLVDNSLNLKISYEITGKKLKLGLWFNDKLYNNEYFYSENYEQYLTGGLGIYAPKGLSSTGVLTIKSEILEFNFSETLNPNLEMITFRDFGIENGRYKYNQKPAVVAQGSFDGTLEGKVFSGNVTFSEQAVHLLIGGEPNEECGIYLGSGQLGYSKSSLVLRIGGYEPIEIKPKLAGGVKLVGETFNLKLSYEVIDTNNDGQKDTLKFGIWFNDKLYNNEYLYVSTYDNYVYADKEYTGTYKNLLSPRMGIYTESKGSSMKVASVGTEVLSSKLKQITFSDFGIVDDIYTYVGDLAVSGTYADTLANKVICGDVTFSSKPATLYVGGEPDVKNGMSITSATNGNLIVKLGDNEYTLTPDVAGATLVGKAFNLKLSYQVVDDDGDGKDETLQLGVWINDKLYNDEYFTVSTYGANRTYTDYLTGRLAVYPTIEGASIKLVSDKPKVMDPSLEKITFADFSVSDGTYTVKHGMYNGSLDGKYFSGNVTFAGTRSDIWIGGHESFWEGMGLLSGYKGDTTNLHLLAGGRDYTFTPEIAGTTLVGADFNLKLSYQVVDRDGDGKKDALQLGVWFNNKLYNNQYIYITNYEHCLGGCMGIYTEGEDSYVTVASDLAIDNPALGSRRAPSPNTGDTEDVVLYISLVVLAMLVICVFAKRRYLE